MTGNATFKNETKRRDRSGENNANLQYPETITLEPSVENSPAVSPLEARLAQLREAEWDAETEKEPTSLTLNSMHLVVKFARIGLAGSRAYKKRNCGTALMTR